MITPDMFVVHRNSPYVIREGGSEVYRIEQNGSLSRLTQKDEIDAALFHHTVVTESEALILAYARPMNVEMEERPQAKPRAIARDLGRLSKLPKKGASILPLRLTVLLVLLVIAMPFIPLNWGILIQVAILVLAIPAVVFPITFMIVVLVGLYLLIESLVLHSTRE